jgi:hypothetical protein
MHEPHRAEGRGSNITIRVKGFEQAGGLSREVIEYAAVFRSGSHPPSALTCTHRCAIKSERSVAVQPPAA